MVQLIQQQLAMNRKSKNLEGAQFMRLDVSAAFCVCWNPKEIASNASNAREEMDLLAKRSRQRANFLLSCLLSRLPAEGVARMKVCLPTSKIQF